MQSGSAIISDLCVNAKFANFRLLVWATDSAGEPLPFVSYLVSEPFAVSIIASHAARLHKAVCPFNHAQHNALCLLCS